MWRKIYSIINPVISSFIIAILIQEKFVCNRPNCWMVTAEQHAKFDEQHQQQQLLHPSLLVDTKFWLGNTELGERENWLDGWKPCSLFERISLDERSAISLGDYMDGGSINGAGDIRNLELAQDGILLMEKDTLTSELSSGNPIDPIYIKYLNESGDCLDTSSSDSRSLQDESETGGETTATRLFSFRPTSGDRMSWFNPANWASSLYERDISDWLPESHRIPCSEDVVVFGSRGVALGPTIEGYERSKLLSFKVNFEPSEATATVDGNKKQITGGLDSVNQIRVSKLKIGNLSYNQHEFEQLISSEQYENLLFEFNSTRGLLKSEDGFAYPSPSLLTIDESSIQPDTSSGHYCLDEAGCLCGNDNTNVLRIICSFNDPISETEQPCHDPIQSSGYCNKICATSITITMDPVRFSEKFVSYTLNKMLSDGEVANYFADSVFTGARRTHDNKYEITFRYVPLNENDSDFAGGGSSSSSSQQVNYETNLGKEREFAQLVYEKLNNGATKTFYGIKSMSIRSSVDWRRSNREPIFWISYFVLSLVAVIIFIIQDHTVDERLCPGGASQAATTTTDRVEAVTKRWFVHTFDRLMSFTRGGNFRQTTADGELTESFVRYTEPIIMSDSTLRNETPNNRTTPEIPLVDLGDTE